MFLATYMLYVIGYTIVNMTAQTLPTLMTNDPRQRPTVGVWNTVFNYIEPMAFMIILNTVLLPKYGQITVTESGGYAVNYSQAYLTAAATVTVLVSLVGMIRSAWRYEEGKIVFDVEVPVQADLILPDGSRRLLTGGTYQTEMERA